MNVATLLTHAEGLLRTGGVLNTARLGASLSLHLSRLYKLKRLSRRPIVVISLMERLGDLVACEPMISQVSDLHPGAQVFWCLSRPYQELFQRHPGLEGILTVNSLSEWRALSTVFPFDAQYDLHPSKFPCHVFRPPFRKKLGDSSVTMTNYYHFEGGLLGAFSRSAGIKLQEKSPTLSIPTHVQENIDLLGLPKTFCVAHTRSQEKSRDWQDKHWQRLQRELTPPLIEIGTHPLLESPVGSTQRCTILEQAEIIRRAQFFVGIDSGPAHLAHAVRTPGVILLGSYRNFRRYNPYVGFYAGPPGAIHVRVNGPCSEIPYESVLEAIQRRRDLSAVVSDEE